MIINSSSLTGISSIFCTTPNRKHLTFAGNGSWISNVHYDPVFYGLGHNYHGTGDWYGWCEIYGQVAGTITLQGGTSVDYGLSQTNYALIQNSPGTLTLIDMTCIMSYHAGGSETAATQVYGFRGYYRVIYNSAGTPSVSRALYYGHGSGSASLDTDNFTIVVVGGIPYFRFSPASASTATVTNITYFGQVVQSI